MDPSLPVQAQGLGDGLLLGLGLGLLYGLLQPLRRRTGPFLGALLDLLLCLLGALGCFAFAMGAPTGRLGQWELAAALLGFLLYLRWLDGPLTQVLEIPFRLVRKIMDFLKKTGEKISDFAKKTFKN